MRANADKYTKNLHRHYLDDGGIPATEEAGKLMREHLRVFTPKSIGHWLQVNHREVFNEDFAEHVAKKKLSPHPASR